MTDQVIFSMVRVGRMHPPNRQVLRDISLGFYYGAKIGVLGLNGAGKSTLLRIMAGIDTGYSGELSLSKGYTVAMLEQEPQLDPAKTVRQVIEEAAQPILDLLAAYDQVSAQFAEPDADFDALIESHGLDGHGIYYYVPTLLKHFTTSEINALIAPRPHLSAKIDYRRALMQKLIKAFENMMVAITFAEAGEYDEVRKLSGQEKESEEVLAAASEPLMVSKKS